jgi:Sulfatase
MDLLKKIPFFLVLLVVFFCLHGSVENYGFLEVSEVLLVGGIMLVSIALLFGLIFLITRNYVLAALITFFVSLWYLFFGALHDWVKAYSTLSFMSSYSVLLPLLLLLTILLFIFFKRQKVFAVKLVFYLNVLLLIYCVIDSALLANKYFTPEKKLVNTVSIDMHKVGAKPDVYFLMFDEYPGYQSLKDSFGFANDSLYSFLQKKDFQVLPLFSNYDFTLFSMSAILNMQYVDTNYEALQVTQRDFQIRTNEIRNGRVFTLFKQMGYDIKNYSIFDIGKMHGLADQNALLPVHSLLLTDKILHNRIIRTSGWLFKTGKLSLPSWRKKYLYQHETNNLLAQQMINKTAIGKKVNPTFSYAHFILPHWPFYRDSTGKYNSDEIIAQDNLLDNKPLYISYVKYTNTVIRSLVDTITAKDPGAIVVVMSDHGFRYYKNIVPFEPFNFNNICAMRIPGKTFQSYSQKWSAVNFFRYLFNTAYNQDIPYLKDSSVLLNHL